MEENQQDDMAKSGTRTRLPRTILRRIALALYLLQYQLLAQPMSQGYTIPTIDLAQETHRQVIVDREAGQYLG
ncbi:MAG: hypothetical protein P8L18_11065, partial [Verrucomicrobiota bacterium]|nr:hypothetical protein [Verrucomicrobiota bacterium]